MGGGGSGGCFGKKNTFYRCQKKLGCQCVDLSVGNWGGVNVYGFKVTHICLQPIRAGNSARRKAHPDTSSSPPSTLVCGALVLQENSGQLVAFRE